MKVHSNDSGLMNKMPLYGKNLKTMILSCLTFLQKGQIGFHLHLYGKNIENC